MSSRRLAWLAALGILLGGAAAWAEPSAKEHYQKATGHFAIGEFSDAASEYEAAFKLKQDPALLFNAAQSHRLAGHHQKALILYKNYIQLFPHEKNIGEVRAQLDKLTIAIQADESAKTQPPTGAVEPSKPLPENKPGETTPPPPPTTTQPSQPAQQPPPVATQEQKKQPIYKKWWLWTIVGVVVAGGVVTGAVLGAQSSSSWSNVKDIGPGAQAISMGVRF